MACRSKNYSAKALLTSTVLTLSGYYGHKRLQTPSPYAFNAFLHEGM